MRTEEELQACVDKEYPDLHLDVCQFTKEKEVVFHILGQIEFGCYLKNTESLDHIKSRLLSALEDAKKLIEHNIAEVKGTQT